MLKFLKKYYFLLVLIPVLSMRVVDLDIWSIDNYIVRVLLIPIMGLIIYLAFTNLKNDVINSTIRFRWAAFDIAIILISVWNIIQTVYYIIKYGITIYYKI